MPVIPEIIGPATEAVNLVTWGTGTVYQFAAWYTLGGEARIGRIVRGTQRFGINHDQYQIGGTPRTTLALPRTNDGHNIIAIAIDGLGRLHVWANMHSAPMRAIRTVDPHTSNTWMADSGWTSAVSDLPGLGNDVTYPYPTHMPDGSLIFYMRDGTSPSGSGRCDSHLWRRANNATTWTGPQLVWQGLLVPDAKGPGVPGDDQNTDTDFNWSVYPSGPLLVESPRSPHPGRLHTCWVWRPDAIDGGRLNPLPAYAYSDDGGTNWFTVQGTALTLPFTPLNNHAARLPGSARILSITRTSNVVTATLDTGNHGLAVGQQITVQVPQDATFDVTATITNVIGADVVWSQVAANASTTGGYVGYADYQNTQAIAIDDDGHPHILMSTSPVWYWHWTGNHWERTQLPTNIGGITHAGAGNAAFWMRGHLWLLKSQPFFGRRQPAAFNLTGTGLVRLGGPIYPFGGHESSYDPEAYRRFGTVEVLCCDGDNPRVYTFGNGPRGRTI